MPIDRGERARSLIRDIVARDQGGAESFTDPVSAILPGGSASYESEVESLDGAESPVSRDERDDLLHRTARKVVADAPLDDDEQFALEAIIIPDKRPAIDVVGGSFRVTHPQWLHLNEGDARARIEAAIPSVGRIELPSNPLIPFAGTGFVVGDGLLMTNRHVAVLFAGGPGELAFFPGATPAVDLLREAGPGGGGSLNLRVTAVVMIHPYWDMALLRVEGLTARQTPLTLSLADPDTLEGRDVALIGYPAFDPLRNDQAVQNHVFGGVFNVKRLMPGVFTGRQAIRSFGKRVSSLTHDASTLGGASGSVVLDVLSGDVVGLHFAGIYLKSNYGVPAHDLARDGRVIDAGVRFAGTPQRGSGEWDEWWRKFAAAPRAEATRAPSVAVGAQAAGAAPGEWTIPITLTVRVGDVPQSSSSPAPAATESVGAALPADAFVALGDD